LFSGSIYGDEPVVKKEFYDSGELKSEIPYRNGKAEGLLTGWYKSGEKEYESH
jgi:antitoxin component YwqK of YwqJK toxin-antitoxin module